MTVDAGTRCATCGFTEDRHSAHSMFDPLASAPCPECVRTLRAEIAALRARAEKAERERELTEDARAGWEREGLRFRDLAEERLKQRDAAEAERGRCLEEIAALREQLALGREEGK